MRKYTKVSRHTTLLDITWRKPIFSCWGWAAASAARPFSMYSRSWTEHHLASRGWSAIRAHHRGAAMTNGKMPSMMNSHRQSEKERIQPERGAVMIDAMAMFIIQNAYARARSAAGNQ